MRKPEQVDPPSASIAPELRLGQSCPDPKRKSRAGLETTEPEIVFDTCRGNEMDMVSARLGMSIHGDRTVLPHAGRREIQLPRADRRGLCRRQARIVQHRPEQDMGVEQDPQSVAPAAVEHLRDVVVAREHVLGERERALHRADQRPPHGPLGGDDAPGSWPGAVPPMTGSGWATAARPTRQITFPIASVHHAADPGGRLVDRNSLDIAPGPSMLLIGIW